MAIGLGYLATWLHGDSTVCIFFVLRASEMVTCLFVLGHWEGPCAFCDQSSSRPNSLSLSFVLECLCLWRQWQISKWTLMQIMHYGAHIRTQQHRLTIQIVNNAMNQMGWERIARIPHAHCEYVCNILLIIFSFAIYSFSHCLCVRLARYLLCVVCCSCICLRVHLSRRTESLSHTHGRSQNVIWLPVA